MKDFNEFLEEASDIDKKLKALKGSVIGHIGKDFAKKASDGDIIKMSDLKDELAAIHNQHIKPVTDQIDSLRKKYKLKPLN